MGLYQMVRAFLYVVIKENIIFPLFLVVKVVWWMRVMVNASLSMRGIVVGCVWVMMTLVTSSIHATVDYIRNVFSSG